MRVVSYTLLAVLFAAPLATAGDWPQWLGPNRDGGSAEKVAAWDKDPPVVWKKTLGPGHSSPVVADGRVFMHARVADKEEEEVVALDAKTGEQVWRTSYARAPYFSIINTGPQATPAVVEGRVYTFGITGVLSCFKAKTGEMVWQVDAYDKLKVKLPRFGVCCSPLVVGDRVLVSVGGKGSAVVAFDADSGEIAWKALDDPISTASPALFLNRAKKATAPEAVFVNGQGLVGLDPFNGNVLWDYTLADQPLGTAPSPIVVDDLLMASTNRTGGVGVKVSLDGDKTTAARTWQNPDLTGYFSTPVAVGKEHFYMVTTTLLPQPTTTLRCIEAKTGKELWNEPKVGFFHAALLRTGDDRLLMLDDAGVLKLFTHDPKGYQQLAKAKVCGATFSAPALANGRLYARDDKGVICVQVGK